MNRRSLITGIGSLVAAPAIVRVASLMPIRGVPMLSKPLCGISPSMQALIDVAEMNEMNAELLAAFDLGAFGMSCVEVLPNGHTRHVPLMEMLNISTVA